ncbi:MAG: phosphatidate cytidylyltransferase [Lachnospiraceae bacterium]|jgi:phosphatidate cytidylyltransferase|nr:phosphatidate cytidylyltransferase [Lachnospiraceae bacterium]
MFIKRLISGIVLLIILAAGLILGGNFLLFLLEVVSLVGLFEIYRLGKVSKNLLGLVGYVGSIMYYLLIKFANGQYLMPAIVCVFILMAGVYVFLFPRFNIRQVCMAFFGFFYVSVLLSYVLQIRMMTDGKHLVWLVIIASWGSDIFAYCVGMLFGKTKMAPKLSPKKSVEGAIGGLVGAGVIGLIYALIVNAVVGTDWNVFLILAICVIGALVSMIGDLTASAIKRNFEIKDFSNLIPGHGGILDRFDSVIMIAPIVFYFLILINR